MEKYPAKLEKIATIITSDDRFCRVPCDSLHFFGEHVLLSADHTGPQSNVHREIAIFYQPKSVVLEDK